ncbi:hypothetical protein, conserved [Trypanosoma brucei gambiense DAL972]|uniref:YqgF/RNase H-like domain-containing protein n=1 Tax=Trypanosoma brucei gambiense (strain MHOM/CI/86/DAL972) TaxID=679716 RepID=D0A7I8_TRYB9|nr:hypothetical protein, conserved [Trypanosoma brucei gambiense DAL972]CBH17639.1 hypothetical protein, conserved [Trypanosoma brucei gambiense DAL972]|eukprot:XP_011779903.1 hypothetical protein, conserved [Trypanosoma brucei gambiense DAL972]
MLRYVKRIVPAHPRSVLAVTFSLRAMSTKAQKAGNSETHLYRIISQRLNIPQGSACYVVEQTKKGSTVPFLARYRRDETGYLDETTIRQLLDMAEELREVQRRREFMLKSLEKRNLLTRELQETFEKLVHLNQLEDAWEPFKEKKTGLAHRGREAGLEPLAKKLLYTTDPIDDVQQRLRCVDDGEKLLRAIVVEEVQRCDEVRQIMLTECRRSGTISCALAGEPGGKSANSDSFEKNKKHFEWYGGKVWPVQRISAHHFLALQRGESEGVLKVKMAESNRDKDVFFAWARRKFYGARRPTSSVAGELLQKCLEEACKQVVRRTHATVRRDLKKSAIKESLAVFAHNLRHILLQRPMRDARILAMDPGFKMGVKCVALDENGGVIACFCCTLSKKDEMKEYIGGSVGKMNLNKIVIGNGTASGDVADVVAATIKEKNLSVEYAIVSEAGASVYSVSDVAKEEFPTLDPMYRGAVSIGRRVIDPLSELVKVPVRSMGIGMYQHDISEVELTRSLNRVVESCVASVGVNAMVANRYVMEKIPGVTKRMVDQIVLARHAKKLMSREDLRRVPGMTETVYKQIAGFFRFPNSTNPLDGSNIHPESYPVVQRLIELFKGQQRIDIGRKLLDMKENELKELTERLGCGKATLELLAHELATPALDPRSELPFAGHFRRAPRAADIKCGDKLAGVVRCVTTFGAFVDVGLHDDVLVHDVDIDAVCAGSFLDDIVVQGVDRLGRIQVKCGGQTNSRGVAGARGHAQGLAIESEEIVSLGAAKPEDGQMLSSCLAEVRKERRQLFASDPSSADKRPAPNNEPPVHAGETAEGRKRKREGGSEEDGAVPTKRAKVSKERPAASTARRSKSKEKGKTPRAAKKAAVGSRQPPGAEEEVRRVAAASVGGATPVTSFQTPTERRKRKVEMKPASQPSDQTGDAQSVFVF